MLRCPRIICTLTMAAGWFVSSAVAVSDLLVRNDSATPTIPGNHPPHITATLGIDNIRTAVRQPVITGLQVSGGVAALEIGDLMAGTSNVLEEAQTLVPPSWTNRVGFVPAAAATNLNVPLDADAAHFRLRAP